ncbi:hypothetical protein MXE38_06130 [Anaerobiospirillum sp. NML120448]|uniref:hypothetical protein n=1 Tax=Anaerobiospirillum sp. NML120448 TaxID=2932816 RepID=UPI001FF43EF8|nr:hypothetical protein [Anaerobiospirillum sp. NML120448]MCK0514433.1 hypothetical protein [Anaerobiospirillum sp. NML120448]
MAYYAYQKLGSYCKRQIFPYRNSHYLAMAIAIAIANAIANAIALALTLALALALVIAIAIVEAVVAIALLRTYPYLNFRVPALGLIVAV